MKSSLSEIAIKKWSHFTHQRSTTSYMDEKREFKWLWKSKHNYQWQWRWSQNWFSLRQRRWRVRRKSLYCRYGFDGWNKSRFIELALGLPSKIQEYTIYDLITSQKFTPPSPIPHWKLKKKSIWFLDLARVLKLDFLPNRIAQRKYWFPLIATTRRLMRKASPSVTRNFTLISTGVVRCHNDDTTMQEYEQLQHLPWNSIAKMIVVEK